MHSSSAKIMPPQDGPFFDKPIMSISEVATLLDKSVVTIRRWVAANEIPHRRIKRSTYFMTEEILEWVDKGE